jgi:choline-sulfatase
MYDHVVLISIDTLRADGIACNPCCLWRARHGALDLKTPFLDDLARRSAFFTNAITAAPYTSAAHASILTGLWPSNHGAYEFFGRPIAADTLFTSARKHGYDTVLRADFPVMLGPHLGFTRDVDRYIVEDDDAYVEAVAASRRSCSLLHFGSLHIPYGFHNLTYGGRAYAEHVAALEAEIARDGQPEVADVLNETYRSAEDLQLLLRYKRVIMSLYARGQYRQLFQLYLAGIETACAIRIEPVLHRVQEALKGRRTLFVLFGDHGEEYGPDVYGHFNSVDEGVLRVPILFWGDGIRPGLHTTRIRTIDILPTVKRLLGWDRPDERLDGESLDQAFDGGGVGGPRRAFSQAYVARAEQADQAQRRVLAGIGHNAASVRHVLYREAVHEGAGKLSRRFYVAGTENREPVACTPELTYESFDPQGYPQPAHDPAAMRALLALLNGYGQGDAAAQSAVEIPVDLHRHLVNHGYFQRE